MGNFWRICVLVSLYNVVSGTIPLLFCYSITAHTGWSTQHSNDSRSISISFCSQLLFSRFSYFRFRSPHTCLPCYCYGQITNVLEKGTVTAAEAECYFSWAFKEKRRRQGRSRKVYILSMLQKCALRTLLSLAELDYKVERKKKDSLCPAACFTTANAHTKKRQGSTQKGA